MHGETMKQILTSTTNLIECINQLIKWLNDKPLCAEHEFIITHFNFNFRILRFTNVYYTDISHYWFLKTYDMTASISKHHLYVHYKKYASTAMWKDWSPAKSRKSADILSIQHLITVLYLLHISENSRYSDLSYIWMAIEFFGSTKITTMNKWSLGR
jgi:hypothetical protein